MPPVGRSFSGPSDELNNHGGAGMYLGHENKWGATATPRALRPSFSRHHHPPCLSSISLSILCSSSHLLVFVCVSGQRDADTTRVAKRKLEDSEWRGKDCNRAGTEREKSKAMEVGCSGE